MIRCSINKFFQNNGKIPKANQPTDVKDYRSILVLPVLSKIYEPVILTVILTPLCSFKETTKIYNRTESGFRKGHSTTTLLLKLRSDICKVMKSSDFSNFSRFLERTPENEIHKQYHQNNISLSNILVDDVLNLLPPIRAAEIVEYACRYVGGISQNLQSVSPY